MWASGYLINNDAAKSKLAPAVGHNVTELQKNNVQYEAKLSYPHNSLRDVEALPLKVEQMMSAFNRTDFLAFVAPLTLLSHLTFAYIVCIYIRTYI